MQHTITTPLHPVQESEQKFAAPIRILAHFFSYVFHPLFVPVIGTWYLAFVHEGYFVGISPHEKLFILITVAYNTIIFPALSVLLLKGVGFIKSIFLKTQRERIIPYVAANLFYFWIYLVVRNNPEVPVELTAFIFGIFLSSCTGLFANTYFKISMHALGMGALVGLLLVMILSGTPYIIFLSAIVVILLAGLVGTSRMIVSDHHPFEIYTGFFAAILCQFIAALFIAS